MEIRNGIIAFYREQFVQNVRTLIHTEKGFLVRAEALNQIDLLTRHLHEGVRVHDEMITRADVFDPAFCWWFEEHNENMLRMCERDLIVRSYEDLLDDKIYNPNTGQNDTAMTMAKARNNLRYFIRHVMNTLLDPHANLDDIETARRQLKSKIKQAKKPRTHPHAVDARMIGILFEETLLRDASLFKRYHEAKISGGMLHSNGFLQLREALKESDIPAIPTHKEEVALLNQMDDGPTSGATRLRDEVRNAQKALIDVLDGVTNRSIHYAEAAEEATAVKDKLNQSMQQLTNQYVQYKSLKRDDAKPAQILDLQSILGKNTRENINS